MITSKIAVTLVVLLLSCAFVESFSPIDDILLVKRAKTTFPSKTTIVLWTALFQVAKTTIEINKNDHTLFGSNRGFHSQWKAWNLVTAALRGIFGSNCFLHFLLQLSSFGMNRIRFSLLDSVKK
jgi:hypothetical protein